jgi:hypothetical protein
MPPLAYPLSVKLSIVNAGVGTGAPARPSRAKLGRLLGSCEDGRPRKPALSEVEGSRPSGARQALAESGRSPA